MADALASSQAESVQRRLWNQRSLPSAPPVPAAPPNEPTDPELEPEQEPDAARANYQLLRALLLAEQKAAAEEGTGSQGAGEEEEQSALDQLRQQAIALVKRNALRVALRAALPYIMAALPFILLTLLAGLAAIAILYFLTHPCTLLELVDNPVVQFFVSLAKFFNADAACSAVGGAAINTITP